MKYFLAVDGGGTKTISAVFDSDGCRLSEGLSKSANALLSSIDEATDNVIESCSLALAKAGLAFSNIEKIYLFIPGFGECIDNFSHKVGAECVLEKEGNALHYSAFRGKDGVIALAGTGSFAVTYYNDNVYKAGGWGTIYGDEGSGYEIGAKALRLCAIAFDEGRETELLCAVKKELNIQDFNDTRGYIYGNKDSRRIVAGLCKVVCQKAQESESESVGILKECAHNLAELTMRSFTMSGSRSLRVCLSGGVSNCKMYVDEFAKQIAILSQGKLNYIESELSIIDGAILYALSLNGIIVEDKLL